MEGCRGDGRPQGLTGGAYLVCVSSAPLEGAVGNSVPALRELPFQSKLSSADAGE